MSKSVAKYNTVSEWPLSQIKQLRRLYPQAFADFARHLNPKNRLRVMMLSA